MIEYHDTLKVVTVLDILKFIKKNKELYLYSYRKKHINLN